MQRRFSEAMSRVHTWWEHGVLFEPKDWIQIEVTSRCNAHCIYCPRTVYHSHWHNRDLPLKTFQRIMPALPKAALTYLQGWGEPLLHPDFTEMVKLAKASGSTVGTTTNGMLLNSGRVRDLIDAGLDILAFSLAGTSPACNNAARPGAPFDRVLKKIDRVRRIKAECNSSTPFIHIAYMLLSSGLADLPALPQLMARYGVEQAVISVLDFEPDAALAGEVLAPDTPASRRKLDALFAEVKVAAAEAGVTVHTPRLETPSATICSENVHHALVVSADGEVSPCVFANISASQAHYAQNGQPAPYRRVTFGNINAQLLPVIWREKSYQRFRESLEDGNPPAFCRTCPKRIRPYGLAKKRL
jgi:MoaA/NifB/PqqE/SkfB family radical SAM enzyme